MCVNHLLNSRRCLTGVGFFRVWDMPEPTKKENISKDHHLSIWSLSWTSSEFLFLERKEFFVRLQIPVSSEIVVGKFESKVSRDYSNCPVRQFENEDVIPWKLSVWDWTKTDSFSADLVWKLVEDGTLNTSSASKIEVFSPCNSFIVSFWSSSAP